MKKFIKISAILLAFLFTGQSYAQPFQADANIWLNTWSSCEKSQNPKAEYGETHWLQYDFGIVRRLSKTWVWNTNDPTKLNQGFNKVNVDYSIDGKNWTHWGEMNFPKAKGEAVYSGFSGPDLFNIEAQYVLLTPISNHGDPACMGIAEIKFNLLTPIDTTLTGNNNEDDCLAIEEFELDELLATEAFFYWDYEKEATFFFEYRESGTEEWIEIETDEFEVLIENLKEGTTYEYQLTVECDEDQYFTTEIRSFTTIDCSGIEGLQVTAIEEEMVAISWDEVEGIEEYVIAYGTVDAEEPIFLETDELSITITNLAFNTEYELAVGIYCGDDNMIWSESIFFTTNTVLTSDFSLKKDRDLLHVYPNPTRGQLIFQYQTPFSDLLNYALYDVAGKMVFQNHHSLNSGQNIVQMDISKLKDGIYFLKTLTMSKRTNKVVKIVKTR